MGGWGGGLKVGRCKPRRHPLKQPLTFSCQPKAQDAVAGVVTCGATRPPVLLGQLHGMSGPAQSSRCCWAITGMGCALVPQRLGPAGLTGRTPEDCRCLVFGQRSCISTSILRNLAFDLVKRNLRSGLKQQEGLRRLGMRRCGDVREM